ncbi:MAG: NAD(P)/FAD-dependent oxidoreductase [Chloroflexi bacterium]|nr:NAD(P)/FAD-dependent oxidoreductase [Chloroflexota bacterium]
MRIGVLGGGALGLTAAYRCARAGHAVTLLERQDLVGGLAAGFRLGDAWLERFYHHLFETDRDIVALIDELGLSSRLWWKKPVTAVLYRGRRYQLDDPASVLRFSPLAPVDRVRLGAALALLKLTPSARPFEPFTANRWLRTAMGDAVFSTVWEPLLRAKFGEFHDQVSMAWFWARVYCRTPRLGYLRGGFQTLYLALAEAVRERGGEIRLNAEVESIASEGGTVAVTVNGRIERFDRVVATLPTRLFARLARGLSEDWLTRHDWGDWLGAHCAILGLRQPLTDIYWLNVNDPGYPFLALVDHANFAERDDYGGLHPVYLGNYLPMSSPRFQQTDDEVLTEYIPALQRINPAFDRSWIETMHVFRAPYAQPVVTREFPARIPPHTTPLPGVYLANMFQVYPQDRGQNYSVRMANRVAQMVLRSAAASG